MVQDPSTLPDDEEMVKDNLEDESNDELPRFKYAITSYGADYPVDGLMKRMSEGAIFVPPFQRDYVWTYRQASRFIESLLLGLPVPGIFLSREPEMQHLLVIDGQQRLKTLQFFYEGVFQPTRREFALRDVQEQFLGKTYQSLEPEDRRRLDDSIIHATIVRQDEPSEDESSIYYIFERLNTGGTPLNAQEIRASIYAGDYNSLLNELNENKVWRALYGKQSRRLRDQEMILRFFAMHFDSEGYEKPMKEFLNRHMASNRHFQLIKPEELSDIFLSAVGLIGEIFGDTAFKRGGPFNAAVYDALMVGIARRLKKGPISDGETLVAQYSTLLERDEFKSATETGTADERSVARRLALATEAFEAVQ